AWTAGGTGRTGAEKAQWVFASGSAAARPVSSTATAAVSPSRERPSRSVFVMEPQRGYHAPARGRRAAGYDVPRPSCPRRGWVAPLEAQEACSTLWVPRTSSRSPDQKRRQSADSSVTCSCCLARAFAWDDAIAYS